MSRNIFASPSVQGPPFLSNNEIDWNNENKFGSDMIGATININFPARIETKKSLRLNPELNPKASLFNNRIYTAHEFLTSSWNELKSFTF